MKTRKILLSVWTLVMIVAMLACAQSTTAPAPAAAPTDPPGPSEADLNATVEAGIQGTQAAEDNMQATIEAAVEATAAVMVTEAQTSEAQLSADIEQAVAETETATAQVDAATQAAAADGTISDEELQELEQLINDAEELIYYADTLIQAYYGLYGEMAVETIELLYALEDDLDTALVWMEGMLGMLGQGAETAAAYLADREAAATQAQTALTQMQTNAQGWQAQVQAQVENRATQALNVQANQVAGNRQEALESAFLYIDTVRNALADGTFSPAELGNIAQLGANASASLQAQGGPAMQNLAPNINDITAQAAKGELAQVQANLGNLEVSLPERPSR